MRDMPARKFETAARGMGFNPAPVRGVGPAPIFQADDGLQVAACLHGDRWNGGVRLHRRRTLARMSYARKHYPRLDGRRWTVPAWTADPNEEAPGAGTPRASV